MKSIGKVLHLFRKSPLYGLKAAWILGSRPGYARRQARHGSWHGGFIFPKVFINDLLFSNRDYAPGLNFVRITNFTFGAFSHLFTILLYLKALPKLERQKV